ncbi:MAG: hypothetical protein ACJAUC_004988, partial [Planctomycetota bacterium]
SHDRVWRDDRSDPVEKSSAEWLALSCEASPLVVVQSRPLLALEFSEDAVLFEHVGDQPRLITVDVACERDRSNFSGRSAAIWADYRPWSTCRNCLGGSAIQFPDSTPSRPRALCHPASASSESTQPVHRAGAVGDSRRSLADPHSGIGAQVGGGCQDLRIAQQK